MHTHFQFEGKSQSSRVLSQLRVLSHAILASLLPSDTLVVIATHLTYKFPCDFAATFL